MDSPQQTTMSETKTRVRASLLVQTLEASGSARVRVFGSSMWPVLRAGDEVTLRRVPVSDLQTGCIVAVRREGRLFVHRLVAISASDVKTDLITRGDTLPAQDPPASAEEFIGIVETVVRKGRVVQLNSRSQRTLGWAFARLAPLSRFWFPAALAVKRFLGFSSRPPRVSDSIIS